ncbi:MAG: ribosome maturation factor RimP [Actinobacteria bacterium]|nr:ribosome maturation factor RimP [Actinomycetota bacterium]
MTDLDTRLWDLIEPYLGAERLELDDLEVVGASGSGRVVRILVDGDEPVDIGRISELSRGIGRLLDDVEGLATSYTLEVGSPGLERKLRRPAHFRKSIGREIKIKTKGLIAESKHHKGVLISCDEASCTVEVDGIERTIPFDAINAARTVFTWERGAKPGKQKVKGPHYG